ncbi:MAG: LptA/OstA family protein, partial [Bryobacteraceae bacterium]
EVVSLKMRDGGEEIETVETQSAAVVEFTPNRPGLPKRTMNGDKVWITYGAENQIESFKSTNVSTRTDNPPKPPKPGQPAPPNPPVLTSSKNLLAVFDPKTSQMTKLEQSLDFRYEEGPRKAQANKGVLDQQKELMTLDGAARVSDPTGSAVADRIQINQKTNDFVADGHVQSTRLPDKKNNSSAMLSAEEPMQARARKMTSTDNNQKLHYEGDAVAWQGANRIQGDRIDIDRENEVLEAHGNVTSQFVDKAKTDDPSKPGAKKESKKADSKKQSKKRAAAKTGPQPAVFTIVKAPDMRYSDEDRVAHYTGGVVLTRPGLQVTAKEIKAFLKDKDDESDDDTSLDKAIADGKVEILQTVEKRKRVGTSEHAEYYAGEEKVILEGGQPTLVDSLKGTTKGKQLTWFSNDDRLLVNGVESAPAQSTIRRK